MQLCKIADAVPGMVLARPIRNADGAVLCPAGYELTETAIRRLENSGVDSFFVEGGEDHGPSPEERIAILNNRFSGIDDPLLLQIRSLVEDHYNAMRTDAGTAS